MNDLQRLQELFDELLDVPAARREWWFAQRGIDAPTRAELLRLAAADDAAAGVLDDSIGHHLRTLAPEVPTPDPIGRSIGPFRLLQRLGQGGMGTVFLAVREGADFEQRVALKLLRHDVFSSVDLALFRRERQLLARLTHPNIARLIDGGVSDDGVPYLAMEFVDGVSITQWCRSQSLDLRARIVLLAKVARAVAAAHTALIVHRDIKPSNVLVGADGEPKLLDFGIAKLLGDDDGEATRRGAAPMTPEYAAPEQFNSGAITTATDVYALGVLLYELLTGARPLRDAVRAPSVQLAATRDDGASLSTATRRIRGDLDKVVLMALADEPERRYPTASALADDLDRHLAHQPVVAHPPSAWYRGRKFVQRHRGGVLVTVLLVLGILASLAATVWQARQAREQAQRAERVSDFLIEVFETAEQALPREQRPTPEMIVRDAAKRLDADSTLDAVTRATLISTLAEVSRLAGEYPRALELADRAIEILRTSADEQDRLLLRLETGRAETLWALGRIDEARDAMLPRRAQLRARDDEAGVMGIMMLAALEMGSGQIDAAIASAHEAAAMARRGYGADARETLLIELFVGDVLSSVARHAEAVAHLEAVLERWRALRLPVSKDYVNSFQNLSTSLIGLGEMDRGEAQLRQALELLRRIHTAPHAKIAQALQNLGALQTMRGRFDAAAPLVSEAVTMHEQVFGPDHMEVASALDALGSVQQGQRQFDAAIATYLRVTDICTRGQHEADPACGRGWQNLSSAYLQRGRLGEAEAANARGTELRRVLFGESHPQLAGSVAGLGSIRLAQQRASEALELFERALALLEAAGQGAAPIAARIRASLARALLEVGRAPAALEALDQADALRMRHSPSDRTAQLRSDLLRIDVLSQLGRATEAGELARSVVDAGHGSDALSQIEWQRLRAAAAAR